MLPLKDHNYSSVYKKKKSNLAYLTPVINTHIVVSYLQALFSDAFVLLNNDWLREKVLMELHTINNDSKCKFYFQERLPRD